MPKAGGKWNTMESHREGPAAHARVQRPEDRGHPQRHVGRRPFHAAIRRGRHEIPQGRGQAAVAIATTNSVIPAGHAPAAGMAAQPSELSRRAARISSLALIQASTRASGPRRNGTSSAIRASPAASSRSPESAGSRQGPPQSARLPAGSAPGSRRSCGSAAATASPSSGRCGSQAVRVLVEAGFGGHAWQVPERAFRSRWTEQDAPKDVRCRS